MNANILGLIVVGLLLVSVIYLLATRKLKERHAIWWLFAALVAAVFALFPKLIDYLSTLLGVVLSTNLVFFIAIVVLVIVSLQHSVELTKIEARQRILAEELSRLDLEVRELRARLPE